MYRLMRFLLRSAVLVMCYVAVLTIIIIPYAWVVAAALVIVTMCKKGYRYTAYGTARFADVSDIPHMLEGNGLIVGHIDGKISRVDGVKALFNPRMSAKNACQKFLTTCQRKQPKQLVRLTQAVHTAVFAPTGLGKGVSIVVPHLLTSPDSMVVVDFKGELVRITADARRKMGQRVVVIDPFGLVGGKDTFNALNCIDKGSPTAIDECRDLAEALVVRTGQEKEPHWADSAEVWIAAMIATVVCFAEDSDKSLQSVRALLTNPEKMQAAIKLMCESDLWQGMLSRLGHQLAHFKDKELSSTLTTTNRFMRFLDTIAIADNTRSSSFDPAELKKGKMTIYCCLPLDHTRTQSPMLRMWLGSMLRACLRGGLDETKKVHFVCDEAYTLGKMDQIADVLTYGRSYGIRLLMLYQDCGQLRKCWPDGADQTLLANCTQVFFGVNDQQTAEYVSNRLGEFTQLVTSGGSSYGGSSQESSGQPGGSHTRSWNSNDNWQQAGRKLLRPEEVTGLSERIAITFTPGVPPIWTRLIRYYEDSFKTKRGIGLLKSAFDTACLFLTALFLAVLFTALLTQQTYR